MERLVRRRSICQRSDVETGQDDAQTHTISGKPGAEGETRHTHTHRMESTTRPDYPGTAATEEQKSRKQKRGE